MYAWSRTQVIDTASFILKHRGMMVLLGRILHYFKLQKLHLKKETAQIFRLTILVSKREKILLLERL